MSLLRAYISTHKLDVICISETYLDSDISDDDDNLKIAGYNLIRADHSSNTRRGGVCIYYKYSLAFKLLNIHYLKECMNFEISFGGKICNFISLHRLTSQSSDTFEGNADNLKFNLDKIANKSPYLLVVLSYFNVKSSNWYNHDKKPYECSKIDAITSQFCLQQLMKEPTHILTDSSSWIDLLFTTQQMESGVHSSLHQNCHHQIIYAKLISKCFIFHHVNVKYGIIQRAIEHFFGEKSFRNLNINEMHSLFNKTIKNILSNHIPTKQLLLMTKIHLGVS